jgi:hypothetical protein
MRLYETEYKRKREVLAMPRDLFYDIMAALEEDEEAGMDRAEIKLRLERGFENGL